MKVNDYVKYQGKVVKVVEVINHYSVDHDIYQYILSNGKSTDTIDNTAILLTPEETLEYFKGRFEKYGEVKFEVKDNNYVVLRNYDDGDISIYSDTISISLKDGVYRFELDNYINDLIREFQNWYWRDK